MARLLADADPHLWIPVTESFGWSGRRARKRAIRMLLGQANAALGAVDRPGGRVAAWAMSQAAPALMRKADGRVLAWMFRADPELIVAIAQIQQLTPQLRAARAMMPMEYDDTEDFRSPYLGTGERLIVPLPQRPGAMPFATYTWDTGSHLVTLTAACSDRERFGTLTGSLDDLARTLRVAGEIAASESGDVLRIEP